MGNDIGKVGEWRLGGVDERPSLRDVFAAAEEGAPVTALAFILGDISVAVGDGNGQVSTWFQMQDGQERPYRKIHQLQPHATPVLKITPSQRDKQFLSISARGEVALHHMTSEQTFFQISGGIGAIADVTFAPKADGFLLLGQDGHLRHFVLDNSHPDVTWGILFEEIWYESYPQAEYVWQSTGCSFSAVCCCS